MVPFYLRRNKISNFEVYTQNRNLLLAVFLTLNCILKVTFSSTCKLYSCHRFVRSEANGT